MTVDALVRTEITEIIEELSSEAPLDFMGTGSRASGEIALREWVDNKKKAVDALIDVVFRVYEKAIKEGSEIEELKEFIRDVLGLPGIQLNEATEWVEGFCKKHGI